MGIKTDPTREETTHCGFFHGRLLLAKELPFNLSVVLLFSLEWLPFSNRRIYHDCFHSLVEKVFRKLQWFKFLFKEASTEAVVTERNAWVAVIDIRGQTGVGGRGNNLPNLKFVTLCPVWPLNLLYRISLPHPPGEMTMYMKWDLVGIFTKKIRVLILWEN